MQAHIRLQTHCLCCMPKQEQGPLSECAAAGSARKSSTVQAAGRHHVSRSSDQTPGTEQPPEQLSQNLCCRVRPPGGSLTTTYQGYLAVGTALIILFAVIAPASYFLILFRLRHRLEVRRLAIALPALCEPEERKQASACWQATLHMAAVHVLKLGMACLLVACLAV